MSKPMKIPGHPGTDNEDNKAAPFNVEFAKTKELEEMLEDVLTSPGVRDGERALLLSSGLLAQSLREIREMTTELDSRIELLVELKKTLEYHEKSTLTFHRVVEKMVRVYAKKD